MGQVRTEGSSFELFLCWILEGFSSNPYHNPMKYKYHYFHYILIIMHCTKYHVNNRCSISAKVL